MSDLYKDWEKYSSEKMKADDLDAAYIKVKSIIDGPTKKRKRISCYIYAAVVVLCLFVIPVASIKTYKKIQDRTTTEISLCQVSTQNGERRTVILPDSSAVILNAASTLIYPDAFNKGERTVFLYGEATFDVVHNEAVPFVVNTMDFSINVHGTVFNVDAYPDSRFASATLCSGSITAEVKESGKKIEMAPQQCLKYDRNEKAYELFSVNPQEYTSWQQGEMCFSGESIHDIARSLERGFDVNVYVTSGKFDQARITAKFLHGETLDEMMKAVCLLIPDMSYSIVNSNVYIK